MNGFYFTPNETNYKITFNSVGTGDTSLERFEDEVEIYEQKAYAIGGKYGKKNKK